MSGQPAGHPRIGNGAERLVRTDLHDGSGKGLGIGHFANVCVRIGPIVIPDDRNRRPLLRLAGHAGQRPMTLAATSLSVRYGAHLAVDAITLAAAPGTAGEQIAIGLDCAASEFYKDGKYVLEGEGGISLTSQQWTDMLATWVDKYPIISIEDGMAEGDWDGWKVLTDRLAKKVQIVGDDLFVTNTKIFKEGIDKGIANSILIKINQIGTLTETFAAIEMAKRAGYTAVISHRSGETEDSTIADIAVGLNAGQIKTGSMSRSDRMAKYNQLLRIEEDLGDIAVYPGREAFYNLR